MKSINSLALVIIFICISGCGTLEATMEAGKATEVATKLAAAEVDCSTAPTTTQTVNSEGFALNISACLYYAGSGERPVNPATPMGT